MRLALAFLLVARSVFADVPLPFQVTTVSVVDADDAIGPQAITAALTVAPIADAMTGCAHAEHVRLYLWVVFEAGKVTHADAGGSTDKKLEACLVKAVRPAKLGTKARVAAAVELVTQSGDQADATPASAGSVVAPHMTLLESADDHTQAKEIDAVIRKRAKEFHTCYESQRTERTERTERPTPGHKLGVHLSIDEAGNVIRMKVGRSFDEAVASCLVRVASKIRFPASASPSEIDYP